MRDIRFLPFTLFILSLLAFSTQTFDMGEKITKSPIADLDRSSSAQQDTHDAHSIEHVTEISGVSTPVAALDPNSEEYKLMEKRLVRKIDIRLMPILVLLYIL